MGDLFETVRAFNARDSTQTPQKRARTFDSPEMRAPVWGPSQESFSDDLQCDDFLETPEKIQMPEFLELDTSGDDMPILTSEDEDDIDDEYSSSSDAEPDPEDSGKKKHKKKIRRKGKRKWFQGRDKFPSSASASQQNDILRASFEKLMPSWLKQFPDLSIIDNTAEIDGVTRFQVGCRDCMAYLTAHPEDKAFKNNKWATGEQFRHGVKKDTFLRHGWGSRSKLHQDAVKWRKRKPESLKKGVREDVPSAAQFRIAYSMVKENPQAATGAAYVKACVEARAGGDENVPSHRCSEKVFSQTIKVVGKAVVHDLHRLLAMRNNKNPPQWACLAEDNGGGISQKAFRVAFKDLSALDILLDWKHHCGKNKACELNCGLMEGQELQ